MKEVFIFGAGASNASAGTPLGNGLVWNYYPDCQLLYEIKPDGKPDLTELNERYDNYTSFLGLAYVDEMVRILQEVRNNEGIGLIRQLVLEHITEKGLRGNNSLYNEFVKSLIQMSKPEDVSIISINFDYLLESEFVDKNYFDYFDYLVDFDMIDTNRTNYKKNGIPLIKLNGSLDWGICQKCRKTILLPRQIGKNGYKNLCCKMSEECGGEIYPLIFLPHEEKVTSVYKGLRNRTKEILKQVRKITVIGYSFPFYDRNIINLFKEFTYPNVVVEIVDYEVDAGKIKCKEREILAIVKEIFRSSEEIKISLDGFQGYMGQLRCTPCMK